MDGGWVPRLCSRSPARCHGGIQGGLGWQTMSGPAHGSGGDVGEHVAGNE